MRYVVLGEALIDLIPQDRSSSANLWTGHPGGSPLNVATGLGQLGEEAQFLGRLSTDAFGEQLMEHLSAHNVGTELVARTSDPTTLAVVSLDAEGKATYAFHTHRTSNVGWVEEDLPSLWADDWLHFGSIGMVMDPSYEVLREFITRHQGPKSFDINARPSIIPDRDEYLRKVESLLAPMAGEGNVVKASDEDLAWLGDGDALHVAQTWCMQFGLGSVVITLGGDGVVVVGADGELARHPGFKVDVVDTVGAGDTFMAGFLARIPDGDLNAALEYGSAAAALVCTRAGAQPPTSEEVSAFIA